MVQVHLREKDFSEGIAPETGLREGYIEKIRYKKLILRVESSGEVAF